MSAMFRRAMTPLIYPLKAMLRALPPTVAGPLAFEIRSRVGRLFARRLQVDRNKKNYLNLGAANDNFENYIALDFFSRDTGYGADLRYPLLIDDEVFDGIFTEHTLEHLNYAEVSTVLGECLRILKPGGKIRVIVPDLSIFAENFARKNDEWFRAWEQAVLTPRNRKLVSNLEALSFETQEFGHRSAWDFDTMERYLLRAGFKGARKCSPGTGSDPLLIRDKNDLDRTMVSLYVEAHKAPENGPHP